MDALSAYFSAHILQGGERDRQKALERIVTSEIAKPIFKRLSKTFDNFGWQMLFCTAIDAAFMQFDAMHAALPGATRMQSEIIEKARGLAELIDQYKITCFSGKVNNWDHGIPSTMPRQLKLMADQLAKVEHKRIGVGVSAWAGREQAGDGLGQFVRYLDARIDWVMQSVGLTPGVSSLSSNSMARLAAAVLNIRVGPDDTLGKIEARVKQFRKQNRG
jgi:hypothetical protein